MKKTSIITILILLSFLFLVGCGETGEITNAASKIPSFDDGDDVALPYAPPGDDNYDFDEPDGDSDYDETDVPAGDRNVPYSWTKEKKASTGGGQGSMIICPSRELPAGDVGESFTHQLDASGGTGSIRYDIYSGTLPEGLELSKNGLISGTPSSATKKDITVTISDGNNSSRVCSLNLLIGGELSLSVSPIHGDKPWETIYVVEVLGPDDDLEWSWSGNLGNVCFSSIEPDYSSDNFRDSCATGSPPTSDTTIFVWLKDDLVGQASFSLTATVSSPYAEESASHDIKMVYSEEEQVSDNEELKNDDVPSNSGNTSVKAVALIVTIYRHSNFKDDRATYVDSVRKVTLHDKTSSIEVEEGPNYDPESKVRFCSDSDFRKCSPWMGPGNYSSMNSIDEVGNDKLSSIEFNGIHEDPRLNVWNEAGIQTIVRLYQHSNCDGESVDIIDSAPNLKSLAFNDRTSSIKVFRGPECGTKYCQVSFYQDSEYEGMGGILIDGGDGGSCRNIGEDFYNKNDSISSVLFEAFDEAPSDLDPNPEL